MIYEPAEDSFLLQKTLKKYLENREKSMKILDIGSGSGIQALTAKNLGFKDILTLDINQESVKYWKSLKLKVVKSDLFSNIKKSEKFTLIIFNHAVHKFNNNTWYQFCGEYEESDRWVGLKIHDIGEDFKKFI